jgi:hypothetical protein
MTVINLCTPWVHNDHTVFTQRLYDGMAVYRMVVVVDDTNTREPATENMAYIICAN